MYARAMLTGLPVALLVAVAVLSASERDAALAQQRLGAAPPGTHGVPGVPPVLRPKEIEKRISVDERERLGLPDPAVVSQVGKVHPDVWAVLKTGQMPWRRFKGWETPGFEGTAYVAVYLRQQEAAKGTQKENQEAIRKIQHSVLSRLTASEFSVVLAFRSTPGFIGYVSPKGLRKLARDENVVAVWLDEKPVPEDPPHVRYEPPASGVDADQPIVREPAERTGKIETAVYQALQASDDGYVFVIVNLTPVPASEQNPPAARRAVDALYERVLATLTAADFRVRTRTVNFAHMSGYATAEGLAKLSNHPDVLGVGLEGPLLRTLDQVGSRNR